MIIFSACFEIAFENPIILCVYMLNISENHRIFQTITIKIQSVFSIIKVEII